MAWIQCFMWITLAIISTPACTYPDWFKYYTEGNGYYQPSFQATYGQRDIYEDTQGLDWKTQRTSERYERPIQRVNERSISVTSSIQTVQDDEKRRLQSRVDDRITRIENGSFKIVNDFSKVLSPVGNKKGNIDELSMQNRDRVVFPNESARFLVPQVPEECMKAGICEDVPNYPATLVNKIIKQIGETSDQFKVDELLPEISMRYGEPEEIELCTYREKIISPLAAPDKDGKWHYIVNNKDAPVQGFRVEICTGTSCNNDVGSFFSHTARCKQKYVLRHMMAIDDNGGSVQKPFVIPSCCACVLSLNDD